MYHGNDILIQFGSGYVLVLNNNCNSNNNSDYDPGYDGIYELPEGMEKSSNESKCYLAGSKNFKVLELEVYTL